MGEDEEKGETRVYFFFGNFHRWPSRSSFFFGKPHAMAEIKDKQ
jgi:hypothetical protein